jgi:hypothetical protein
MNTAIIAEEKTNDIKKLTDGENITWKGNVASNRIIEEHIVDDFSFEFDFNSAEPRPIVSLFDNEITPSASIFDIISEDPATIEIQVSENTVEIAKQLVDEKQATLESFIKTSAYDIVKHYDFERKMTETQKLLDMSKDVLESFMLYNSAVKNLVELNNKKY